MTNVTDPDTTATPRAPRRTRAQRRIGLTSENDSWGCLLFEDESPDRIKDIYRVVVDKFQPKCEYDHYLANLSAANTYLHERFMVYQQRLLECKIIEQASVINARYEQIDTHDRAALAFHDKDFTHSMRSLRDAETTCIRRALLVNNELRKPAVK